MELRMPIAEQYVWLDWFLSGVGIWSETSSFFNMTINDYLFSFGAGLRLTVPGFPIGLYLAKRFKFENGALVWQGGPVFPREGDETSGLNFVISFTADIF